MFFKIWLKFGYFATKSPQNGKLLEKGKYVKNHFIWTLANILCSGQFVLTLERTHVSGYIAYKAQQKQ